MRCTDCLRVQSGKKESVIDLSKYIDQSVRVKLLGGREGDQQLPRPHPGSSDQLLAVVGTLRGYDPLVNLVLDEAQEHLRGLTSHYAALQSLTLRQTLRILIESWRRLGRSGLSWLEDRQ